MERKSEKKKLWKVFFVVVVVFFFFFFTEIGGEDLRKDEYFEKFWIWYN